MAPRPQQNIAEDTILALKALREIEPMFSGSQSSMGFYGTDLAGLWATVGLLGLIWPGMATPQISASFRVTYHDYSDFKVF